MPNVSIIINQVGISAGTAGVSRDDLLSGALVTLTNDPTGNVGATSWKWEFISWPRTTATQVAPTLYGSETNTCTFTPINIGTYLIQLTLNGSIRGKIGAAIKTTNLIIRIPGELETNEYPGGNSFGLISFLRTVEVHSGGGGALGMCDLVDVDCSGIGDDSVLVYSSGATTWYPVSYNLCSLLDVYFSCESSIDDGSFLQYSTSDSLWHAVDGALCSLTDVVCGTPSNGDVLTFLTGEGNNKWYPMPPSSGSICDLTDVSCGEVVGGDILIYEAEGGNWITQSNSVCNLYDVDCSGLSTGDVLVYNSESGFWNPLAFSGVSICTLSDVSCTGLSDGYTLVYDSGTETWIPGQGGGGGSLCTLSDVDCAGGDLSIGNGLIYDGANWIPKPVSDRILVFSDDTEFTEEGTAYVTKKTFRIVIDSEKPFAYWRFVFSIWSTGTAHLMSCLANIGGNSYEWTGLTDTSEVIISGTTIASSFTDLPLTAEIQIKADTADCVAHLKYTDIYGIYDIIVPG